MRVNRLFAVSAVIACGTVLPFLAGCGGSHHDDVSVDPSPSPSASPTSGATLAYAGTYTSSVLFRRSTGNLSGPITLVVTADGKFSATITASIVNDSGAVVDDGKGRLGVFNNGDTHTITGTVTSDGYFTGSITVSPVTDTIQSLTDTLSGTLTIQSDGKTLSGPLVLTDDSVQLTSGGGITTYTRSN